MKRFFNRCGPHRANLCLLASGALADGEKAAVENHLAACAGCRKYYDEVKSITLPLANWEKPFLHVEPDQAVRTRWANNFTAATRPVQRKPVLLPAILNWCHDLIWPCRRIWAGFAAIWVIVIAVNFSTQDSSETLAGNSSRPSPEMVRAYLEAEGFFAERTARDEIQPSRPLKSPPPSPRSERRSQVFRA